jgi:polyisoprenyl-phosphate glycosyltransferase
MKLISFVVPVFYEEDCIDQFIKEVDQEIANLPQYSFEYIFIDDGSQDKTVEIIKGYCDRRFEIKLVELSYNHGKEAAVTAGIKNANGDFTIYMDPDLQDPPVEIPRLIAEIEKGFDIVYGIRKDKKDSFINRIYSKIFWTSLNYLTGLDIPKNLAVYRIFNRKFAQEFLKYEERNRFIEGIFLTVGLKSTTLPVSQRVRFAGKSKFNFNKKMNLALTAMIDFSDKPLKICITTGCTVSVMGFSILVSILGLAIFGMEFQAGWPSLAGLIILGLGINLIFLGVIGKYVGKVYSETKQRPLFSIKEKHNLK